eukprot:CAMPEP_0204148066 /NCGR_PEP_ID=MMETSP0361-20130328/23249_1 /ASSEMBLY_ACC=CAM_ASM_000343 /TAXON_ID=268821 /ORGANISM="Scrippsiella Hangoei, Strain SHTV-5" /LENGTH=202 /DNA_ID=CAMNT_0051102355 /DNA_START=155 /DNA_END=760 /DNA_ORIENTATION=+
MSEFWKNRLRAPEANFCTSDAQGLTINNFQGNSRIGDVVELKEQGSGEVTFALVGHARLQLAIQLHAPSGRTELHLQHKRLGRVRQLPRFRNRNVLLRTPTCIQAMVHGDAAAAWSRVEMQQPIGVRLLSPMTAIPAPHVQIPPPTGNRAKLAIEAVGLYSQHVPRRHHAKVGPRCLDLRGVAWTQLSVLPIDWQPLPSATG